MGNITFITGNQHKVEALEHWLGRSLAHQKIDLDELQILDPIKVVKHKAEEAFRHVNKPVLIEDTSLSFAAFGQLPGVYIKWFIQEIGLDGLCNMLNSFADRTATARVIYALNDGKTITIFDGLVEGEIANSPKGSRGFGWDPIFIPNGSKLTYGEMDYDILPKYSVRNLAVQKLKAHLEAHKL